MKIIFLSGGAREKALRNLLEKGEKVEAVIVPFIKPTNDRFKNVIYTAVEFGVKVIPVEKENIYKVLKKIDFDLLISCGFPYILNKRVINLAKLAINVHPTLLPKYRGYRSGPYIIINGETESGVTVHLLTEEMDKGDIIFQKRFKVSKFDTTKSLFIKAQKHEVNALYKAIQLIKNNKIKFVVQDESHSSTYNYNRTPKDSEIDPDKSLNDLYDYIRACDPEDYPAFFYVKKEKVFLKLWRNSDNKEEYQI